MISTFSRPAAFILSATNSRGAVDVGDVLGQSADAGDAKELLQLFEETVLMLFNENIRGWRHLPL